MGCSCGSEAAIAEAGPASLEPGEHLVLWGVRAWAALRNASRVPQPVVQSSLAKAAGARTARLFCMTMAMLEREVRRPLRVQCPRCPGYGQDEQRLLVAFGVADAAPEMAQALLEPMFHDPRLVMTLIQSLSQALAEDGFPLPARLFDASCGVTGAPANPSNAVH